MKLTAPQIEFMQEDLCIELAEILITEQNYTMEEALNTIYNSDTYDRLSSPSTGLYYQSVGYVYDYLKKELTTGKL